MALVQWSSPGCDHTVPELLRTFSTHLFMKSCVSVSSPVPDSAHKHNLSLSTWQTSFVCCYFSALVLSYHVFAWCPPPLWQFWNATFVWGAWKERPRGTRPLRIAAPSALMQVCSICCWKPHCMPRKCWHRCVTYSADSHVHYITHVYVCVNAGAV